MRRFAKTRPLASLFVSVLVVVAIASAVPAYAADAEGSSDLKAVYDDFLHYARLGKFTEADAFAQQLLSHSDLTPLTLLEVVDQDQNSIPTLITLVKHSSISERAQEVLDMIREGEHQRRKDSDRIRANIQKLGGHPQMEFNAIQRLKDSGEYAVRWMVDSLGDNHQEKLWPRIIRALPQLGKPAVAPLVEALDTENVDVRKNLIWALGELGYPQAIPYLLKQKDPATKDAVRAALERIGQLSDKKGQGCPVAAFMALANQYYAEHGSVKADPRLAQANVWYWEDSILKPVAVPTEIYGPIMAMRCCEQALLIEPNAQDAISLWLAANIRREARLGMDVENTEPDGAADEDKTRDAEFPRSIYFSRAAGPVYCHLVLGRALADGDKQVALGAIAALDTVAGASSLIGTEDYKQPLVRALQFPDAEVRIKAAIALARALPKKPFAGSELVAPVLAEGLGQLAQAQYIVVDRDADNMARVADELRAGGAMVIAESNLFAALERAKTELPNVSGVFISTDIDSPAVTAAVPHMRKQFRYARTPVVLLVKPDEEYRVDHVKVADSTVGSVKADASTGELLDAIEKVAGDLGGGQLTDELALELALRTAEVLRMVAIDGGTSIDIAPTIPGLIAASQSDDEGLQIAAAKVLALVPTAEPQQAIAAQALATENSDSLRLAGFDNLAESAKRFGNLLGDAQIKALVKSAMDEPDLAMRAAASQALGAMNLQVNDASQIIRTHHRG